MYYLISILLIIAAIGLAIYGVKKYNLSLALLYVIPNLAFLYYIDAAFDGVPYIKYGYYAVLIFGLLIFLFAKIFTYIYAYFTLLFLIVLIWASFYSMFNFNTENLSSIESWTIILLAVVILVLVRKSIKGLVIGMGSGYMLGLGVAALGFKSILNMGWGYIMDAIYLPGLTILLFTFAGISYQYYLNKSNEENPTLSKKQVDLYFGAGSGIIAILLVIFPLLLTTTPEKSAKKLAKAYCECLADISEFNKQSNIEDLCKDEIGFYSAIKSFTGLDDIQRFTNVFTIEISSCLGDITKKLDIYEKIISSEETEEQNHYVKDQNSENEDENNKNNIKDGLKTIYYNNGNLKATGNVSDYKPTGKWEFYYENEVIKAFGNFKDGKEEGEWKFYYDNGVIKKNGNFVNGKEEGEWKFYNEIGKLIEKGSYDIKGVAPDFTAPTPNGETISLNKILGKYTILNFWGPWSPHCRKENSNLVKLYNKYHDKGLNIISVAIEKEDNKDRWINAISDDNLDWNHVSNLKFWDDPILKLYRISSLPNIFILNENGVIIAKDLRDLQLEKKVDSIFEMKNDQIWMIEDTDGYSNLRNSPNGEILKRVYESEKFEVIGSEGKYKKVKLDDGTIGYIHESRVVKQVNYRVNLNKGVTNVNVRDNYGTENTKVIDQISYPLSLTVIKEHYLNNEKWIYIKEKNGWILSSFVQSNSSANQNNQAVLLQTTKYKIRIDNLGNGNYTYTAWPASSAMNDTPNIVIKNGKRYEDGSGGNHYYTFTNGNYKYKCSINVLGTDETPPANLLVYNNDDLILSQDALIK